MEKSALTRLKIELESFKVLTVANFIGAAFTLAFSMAYGISDLIPLITGAPLTASQIPYMVVIISGFATAIAWITRSAELMGEHDEITKDLDEIMESDEKGDILGELVTGIIVRSLAFYRENSAKIDRLKWGARLTGAYLLISGVPQLFQLITDPQVQGWMIIAQWFAVVSSIAISLAAWYVPVILDRFIETWDTRLNLAEDASNRLSSILEESQ
jgi:hypothetical protein